MNPHLETVRLRADRLTLHLKFSDGVSFDLPSLYLRIFSPSAETGAALGRDPALLLVPDHPVRIERIEPVGHYALRLVFDDGHASGLYTYEFLRDLGETRAERWTRYERRVALAQRSPGADGEGPP
ncbi:MAG: gamma-butyrobetaine hydroxylase family protein [Gammaproteobacteria bacterium]